MEAWFITAVKDVASCLMSLWRKLAYDLAEDMLVPSELNIRNMSAIKLAYQLNVRCDICLWNEESKIVLQSCLLVLRTAFSLEGSDVKKKNWHRSTQTNINTDTKIHPLTHWHPHSDSLTHKHRHSHTHKAPQAYTHTDTNTQAPIVARTQTRTCTHSLSCNTQTHTHILPTHIEHHTT